MPSWLHTTPALASRGNSPDIGPRDPDHDGSGLEVSGGAQQIRAGHLRSDATTRWLFIWPAVLVILALSIFPLVASIVISVSNLVFKKGSVELDFIGLRNYQILLFGTERVHFLGVLKDPNPLGWVILLGSVLIAVWWFTREVRSGTVGPFGLVLRLGAAIIFVGYTALLVQTLVSDGGRPGALVVTTIFVVGGITVQYVLGLILALLAVQQVPGRRFFRVAFLIPLTITPVGVGYLMRMLTDTGKGPIEPIWQALGMAQYSWVTDAWAARVVVILADSWQWIPFMFIVLLAAIEGQDQEVLEAAWVDGASRRQAFSHMTLPAIIPVSTTLILIRLIESFKLIDMPNILVGGGPGTATQSLTLEAYFDWRTLNLGRSAAIAYLLLIVVTIAAVAYVTFVRKRAASV